MPIDELGVGVVDHVTAEMVECGPPLDGETPTPIQSTDATPTAQAQDATIEQTGAGPPPKAVRRG
jgi:hypothetical protein